MQNLAGTISDYSSAVHLTPDEVFQTRVEFKALYEMLENFYAFTQKVK